MASILFNIFSYKDIIKKNIVEHSTTKKKNVLILYFSILNLSKTTFYKKRQRLSLGVFFSLSRPFYLSETNGNSRILIVTYLFPNFLSFL